MQMSRCGQSMLQVLRKYSLLFAFVYGVSPAVAVRETDVAIMLMAELPEAAPVNHTQEMQQLSDAVKDQDFAKVDMLEKQAKVEVEAAVEDAKAKQEDATTSEPPVDATTSEPPVDATISSPLAVVPTAPAHRAKTEEEIQEEHDLEEQVKAVKGACEDQHLGDAEHGKGLEKVRNCMLQLHMLEHLSEKSAKNKLAVEKIFLDNFKKAHDVLVALGQPELAAAAEEDHKLALNYLLEGTKKAADEIEQLSRVPAKVNEAEPKQNVEPVNTLEHPPAETVHVPPTEETTTAAPEEVSGP
jgi:hypothetical protein